MENVKAILENAFHTLSASPLDSRRALTEKADEASLMGEDGAEAALGLLLHPQKRLEAEVQWFPGAKAEEAEALLDWHGQAEPAPLPPLRSDSPQAQFNACRLLIDRWPVADADGAVALCRALAQIDAAVDAEGALGDINRDRGQAGFQPAPDAEDVARLQNDLRRRLASDLTERLSGLTRRDVLVNTAATLYRDTGSMLMEAMVDIDTLSVSEEANRLTDEILKLSNTLGRQSSPLLEVSSTNELVSLIQKWFALTQPNRTVQAAKGLEANSAPKVFHDAREAAVRLANQKHLIGECEKIIRALISAYGQQPAAMKVLTGDMEAIDKINTQAAARAANMYRR